MEGGGFEPPKASPTDLQSVPFGHSGTPPSRIWRQPTTWQVQVRSVFKSRRRDSNPRPADYKSATLPTELRRRRKPAGQPAGRHTIYRFRAICQENLRQFLRIGNILRSV